MDGFELSDELRGRYNYSYDHPTAEYNDGYANTSPEVPDGYTIGILLLTVRNNSYADQYNPG